VQAWGLIRQAFPSGRCTLSLVPENVAEAPKPGSVDERIFAFIENGQTIDEMAIKLHSTDYFLYNRLYAEVFPKPYPARTTIVNCLGPLLRYEIEVVAVKPG
jgi:hypothetical protein